ncbi:endo-1,4-beta-xylanase 5-like [Salvia hispanica]|uniref:endo-1,4-beta-xylanase 5-like n=1 Tax=Salvia hispanica TaxID=49212 RepID=UPI0020090830|nr:endo-1,4-beta-xylanase 5-like [Salvia hispanica]
MALKLLHLVILFIFVSVDITCTNAVGPPKVHVINALTDPSPVHLRVTSAKDDDYERNEILKQSESLDLAINRCGFQVYALPYDYSYILECVAKPGAPLYKGGIVKNPKFNEELNGWIAGGEAKIESAKSVDGNRYAVVSNGVYQSFNVEKGKLYSVSAWFQLRKGKGGAVQIKLVTSNGEQTANFIFPKAGCWSMLKGGFESTVTESAKLQIEANVTGAVMWVDSVSVQPFTQEEWNSHRVESVEKGKVKFEVTNELGMAVADADVSIKLKEPRFPFGNAMSNSILENQVYQKWFLEKRFKYTTFGNELKWEYTELEQGKVNYTKSDAMMAFAKNNGIKVRGHNILWDDPKYATWKANLTGDARRGAAMKRVESVVSKYKGQVIHWDVINENMHHQLYSNVTHNGADVYRLAHQLDPLPVPFLNEFNVIEGVGIMSLPPPPDISRKSSG